MMLFGVSFLLGLMIVLFVFEIVLNLLQILIFINCSTNVDLTLELLLITHNELPKAFSFLLGNFDLRGVRHEHNLMSVNQIHFGQVIICWQLIHFDKPVDAL